MRKNPRPGGEEKLYQDDFYSESVHEEDFCKDIHKEDFGREPPDEERSGSSGCSDFNIEERTMAEQFKAAARTLVPEEERRGDALKDIRKNIAQKTMHQTPPPWELLLVQLQYISSSFWISQGILVGSLLLLLQKTSMEQGALADYLRWISVLAAWMGVLGCGSLGRHFSRGMAELEQSCYFNLPQLWTIKMTLSGMVDILVLGFCSGMIAGKTNLPFGQVCLYVMVPFVLSNVCCLLFFSALRGGRNRYWQLVLALLTGLLATIVGSLPMEAYTRGRLWIWTAVFSGGIGIYLCQLRYMYGKIRRGEIVCWN